MTTGTRTQLKKRRPHRETRFAIFYEGKFTHIINDPTYTKWLLDNRPDFRIVRVTVTEYRAKQLSSMAKRKGKKK